LQVHESTENYLETILVLSKEQPQVRSIDIVNEMGFSKPSVSVAMKNLRQQKYITTDDNGHIKLTSSGRNLAESVYERHTLITNFLVQIGVDAKIAAEDACRVEHVLSPETFEALKTYIKK
jgi:Mn-dependent transcriptional regulator